MQAMESKPERRLLRDYRNAVAHGYVFPLIGESGGVSVLKQPKHAPLSFDRVSMDLGTLSRDSFRYVDEYICGGWRCFEVDELT